MDESQVIKIINGSKIQDLQKSISLLMNISLNIVTVKGDPVTKPSFCINDFNNHFLSKELLNYDGELFINKTLNKLYKSVTIDRNGLVLYQIPIMDKGVCVAYWIVGNIANTKIEENKIDDFAFAENISTEKAREIYSNVKIFEESQLNNLFEYLSKFASVLLRMLENRENAIKLNKKLTKSLLKHDETRAILESISDYSENYIYVLKENSKEIIYANKKFLKLVGLTLAQLENKNIDYILGYLDNIKYEGPINETKQYKAFLTKHNVWVKSTKENLKWRNGQNADFYILQDVTKGEALEKELYQLAYFEKNTNMQNAEKLEKDFEHESYRKNKILCIEFLELTSIVNEYSEAIVQKLFKDIINYFYLIGIPKDRIYRISPDRLVIVDDKSEEDGLLITGEKIQNKFTKPWKIADDFAKSIIFCKTNIAIIQYPENEKISELLNYIDRTMEMSREIEKISFYDEELDLVFKEKIKLETYIMKSIKNNMEGFYVVYQPFVSAKTGKWCGVEALCRWNNPEIGEVGPFHFIPIIEKIGLIGVLGMWILEQSISDMKKLGLDKVEGFLIDVNLSAIQLADTSLADKIIGILHKYDYPAKALSMEITESCKFEFSDTNMKAINTLKEAGISLALDDFGTGYSSFDNLKNLPVSILKTDKSLIDNIVTDEYSKRLFLILAELSVTASMKMIVEGVETAEQFTILSKNGADFLQGYLFAKPMKCEFIEQNIDKFTHNLDMNASMTLNKIELNSHLIDNSVFSVEYKYKKQMINFMNKVFFESDIENCIDYIFDVVLDLLDLSHVFLFIIDDINLKNSEEATFTIVKELIKEGTRVKGLNNKNIPLYKKMPLVMKRLVEEGFLLIEETNDTEDLEIIFYRMGRKAVIYVPFFRDGDLVAIVGFEDFEGKRNWLPEEIQTIFNITLMIAKQAQISNYHKLSK